jgi:hypothetical protein
MKASGVYSKGLKCEEVAERGHMDLTINNVRLAKFEGQADKLELNFGEIDKTLVLNVTNNDFLASKLGDETDDWPGAKIRIVAKKLDRPFKGNTHSITIIKARFATPPAPPVPSEKEQQTFENPPDRNEPPF